jgi:hypothetical protein
LLLLSLVVWIATRLLAISHLQEEIDRLQKELAAKADKGDLTNLREKVDAKAEKGDLTNLDKKVTEKADSSNIENLLNTDLKECGGPHCLDQKMAILRYCPVQASWPEPVLGLLARCDLTLLRSRPNAILTLPGETEVGSAGAQPTKG